MVDKAKTIPVAAPAEKKPLIVETAKVIPVTKDPEPVQEPDKTTIDREPDNFVEPASMESVQPDPVCAEVINSVVRKNPIKRAEAFVSSDGERRVFVYAEGGIILKFIGRFDVSRN